MSVAPLVKRIVHASLTSVLFNAFQAVSVALVMCDSRMIEVLVFHDRNVHVERMKRSIHADQHVQIHAHSDHNRAPNNVYQVVFVIRVSFGHAIKREARVFHWEHVTIVIVRIRILHFLTVAPRVHVRVKMS
jgi:hypothetical protein